MPVLQRPRRKRHTKRYERPVPGERLQVDTIKIANGKYQYTAIDDCTRYQVARLYPRRTAANTLKFLQHVVEEMPFPIQRIQTDRGTEFTAYDVRETQFFNRRTIFELDPIFPCRSLSMLQWTQKAFNDEV